MGRLITRRVTVTGTTRVTIVSLPVNRGAKSKYLSIYNAGTANAVLQIYENDSVIDEIPLAPGEHINIVGDVIHVFNPGSTISVALTAAGDVRVTVTLDIE